MTLSNLIIEFYEKMSFWEEAVVEGSGLSLPKMHIIEILGIYGDLMMKDLAEKVGVTTGTLTIAVDKLASQGIVERIPNQDDRRSYFVSLTPKGIKYHKEHSRAHSEMTSRCLEGFSAEESLNFQRMLKRFTDKI